VGAAAREERTEEMALGMYFRQPSFTPERYEKALERLEAAGFGSPPGRLYHIAIENEGDIDVFDIWESQESFDEFGKTLLPILKELGVEPQPPSIESVPNIIVGVGRADPAAKLRRFYELINEDDIEGFMALLADDFVEHEQTPGLSPTKDGVREFFKMYRQAFPDLRFEAKDVRSSGDTAFARLQITGTHKGDFMGMPATGKSVTVEAIDIVRFGPDGLAHEHWGITDAYAMMQQLGVTPEAIKV
jgi:steroid delta-isomerase-like uncharacterized protein